jgi:tetratricopeptide (TPR) repeat protein
LAALAADAARAEPVELSADEVARQQFQLGVRLLQEQKFLGAADAFEQATRAAPLFFEAHVNRGIALLELGKGSVAPVIRLQRFQEAVERFRRAVELNEQAKLPYLFWAEALTLMGDLPVESQTRLDCYLAAVEKYRRAAEVEPGDWQIYSRWAALLIERLGSFAQGAENRRLLYDEAANLFEKAAAGARFSAELGPVYANWGGALTELARLSTNSVAKRDALRSALDKYEKSAQAIATSATTYTQWGRALIEWGKISGMRTDFRQAIEKFKTALQYRPGDAETLYHLAVAHTLTGDQLLAVRALQEALAADRSGGLRTRAQTDPDLAPLRGQPELREIFAPPDPWNFPARR